MPSLESINTVYHQPENGTSSVMRLPEPYQFQIDAVQAKELAKSPQAVIFAFHLEGLKGNQPNPEFRVEKFPPFYEVPIGNTGEIRRYTADVDSPSMGLVITPFDTATDLRGNPTRLRLDENGDPIFWQMGPEASRMALATRALEFATHHNDHMYGYLRALQRGDVVIAPRSNVRSAVIEHLLQVLPTIPEGEDEQATLETGMQLLGTAATREVGYARMSSDRILSRTKAANGGLILTASGVPSSLFALGGMPPVTGSVDVIETAALSYMRSWIPRNGIYAGDPELQMRLFQKAKERIESLGLPKDIEKICIAQIGVSVGSEDPKEVAEFAKQLTDMGCSAVRIYTTNPDKRTVDTAEAIRQRVGSDMVICVGPIVDKRQADKLIGPNIGTNILLAGHGGGENCTSLAGGGTANSLELLYGMYLDPAFNNTAIGLEGGTGNTIGAFLPMLDVISLNRRGVEGGIELGGLYVEHINGEAVQPYAGSASALTQQIEAVSNAAVAARRLNAAGKLRNVEGKPNYMRKPRAIGSIVDNFGDAKMYAGRALADQNALSISELRRNTAENGLHNHRAVTGEAAFVAGEHRGR